MLIGLWIFCLFVVNCLLLLFLYLPHATAYFHLDLQESLEHSRI